MRLLPKDGAALLLSMDDALLVQYACCTCMYSTECITGLVHSPKNSSPSSGADNRRPMIQPAGVHGTGQCGKRTQQRHISPYSPPTIGWERHVVAERGPNKHCGWLGRMQGALLVRGKEGTHQDKGYLSTDQVPSWQCWAVLAATVCDLCNAVIPGHVHVGIIRAGASRPQFGGNLWHPVTAPLSMGSIHTLFLESPLCVRFPDRFFFETLT